MDVAGLNGIEELVLGLGLAVTAWIGLGLARRMLAYALNAGAFLAGLLVVGVLFLYRPSRVYDWVEQEASTAWTESPSSEQLVDRGIAALQWLEDRLAAAKGVADRSLEPAGPSTLPADDAGDDRAAGPLRASGDR